MLPQSSVPLPTASNHLERVLERAADVVGAQDEGEVVVQLHEEVVLQEPHHHLGQAGHLCRRRRRRQGLQGRGKDANLKMLSNTPFF